MLSGLAGVDTGDSLLVTVRLYAGSTVSGSAVQSMVTTRTFGMYTVQSAPLSPGTYTARAEQGDSAGNTGYSRAVDVHRGEQRRHRRWWRHRRWHRRRHRWW